MFTSKRLYFVASILFALFVWFNLVQFNNQSDLYTKHYAFGINQSLNQYLKQIFGKYFNSDLANVTEDSITYRDDDTIAVKLKKQVKVFIWVMTAPKYHDTRAKGVRDTWGKHCDHLVFFSTKADPDLPAIALNVTEGYSNLTPKTRLAFRYLYENHFNDADWFMKVDDDTFVIIENLRYFLSEKNPDEPLYFGHHFNADIKQGYHSGGAGYVISREALRRFGNSSSECNTDGWAEDMEFGKCMESLNVKIEDSRDALGRSRFLCLSFKDHLLRNYPDWYYTKDAYGGKANISDYAISFHDVSQEEMSVLEYFVYHIKPYGILPSLQSLNRQ